MSTTTTTTTTINKPTVIQNTSTGEPVYVLPAHPTAADVYKANWIFWNLDDRQVKRYEAEGFRHDDIKGAANLAMRTGLPMEFFLDRIKTSGYSLTQLATMYSVTIDNLDADIPGMGAQSIAYAPEDMSMTTPSYASASTTGTISSTATPSSTSVSASSSMPGAAASTTLSTSATPAAQGDLMAVISGDPRFTTLASAIRSAGLASNLQQPGPFTLFAPTNDAFSKLPAGTLDNLMKPENQAQLRNVLLYHVVNGRMMSSDILGMSAPGTPNSLEGDTLTMTNAAPLKVNDANVIATDIPASNGVVQAIDTVLMPPGMNGSSTTPTTTPSPTPSTTPATPEPATPSTTPTTPATPDNSGSPSTSPSTPASPTSPAPSTP